MEAANTSDFVVVPDYSLNQSINNQPTLCSTPVQTGDIFRTPKGQLVLTDALKQRLAQSLTNLKTKKRQHHETVETSTTITLSKTPPIVDPSKKAKTIHPSPAKISINTTTSSANSEDLGMDFSIAGSDRSFITPLKPSPKQQQPRSTTSSPIQLYAGSTNRSFTLSDNYNVDTFAAACNKLHLPPAQYKRCGEGFLITVNSKDVASQFRQIDTLNKQKVLIRPPIWETQIRGVLYVDTNITNAQLQKDAVQTNKTRNQPQIAIIKRITTSPYVLLTFDGTILPPTITFGGHSSKPVAPYLKKPQQCIKCLLYNHTARTCTKQQHCTKCGSPNHTYQHCTRALYCIHCHKPGHSSLSKTCPLKQTKMDKLNPKHKATSNKYSQKKSNLTLEMLDVRSYRRPRSSTPNASSTEELDFTTKTSTAQLQKTLQNIENSMRLDYKKPAPARVPHQVRKTAPTPKPRQPKPYFNSQNNRQNHQNHSQQGPISNHTQPQTNRSNPNRDQSRHRPYPSTQQDNPKQFKSATTSDTTQTQIFKSLITFTAQAIISISKPASPSQLQNQIKTLYQLANNTGLFFCSLHQFKQDIINGLSLPTNFNTRKPTVRYNTNLRKSTRY